MDEQDTTRNSCGQKRQKRDNAINKNTGTPVIGEKRPNRTSAIMTYEVIIELLALLSSLLIVFWTEIDFGLRKNVKCITV